VLAASRIEEPAPLSWTFGSSFLPCYSLNPPNDTDTQARNSAVHLASFSGNAVHCPADAAAWTVPEVVTTTPSNPTTETQGFNFGFKESSPIYTKPYGYVFTRSALREMYRIKQDE
jgi:hypothetical protein